MQQLDAERWEASPAGGRKEAGISVGCPPSALRYISVRVLLMSKACPMSLHMQELLGALMKYNRRN